MTTHLVAWTGSINSATLTQVGNIDDRVLTRSGTLRYFVPGGGYNRIRWAAATGVDVTRAKVVTPSLQARRADAEIVPRRRGANTFTLTGPEVHVPRKPLPLDEGEEIEFQAAEDNAAASTVNGLVALGVDPLPAMPDGDVIAIRATGTTTLVVSTWTAVPLTFESSLPAGTYALVGLVGMSASAIAVRARMRGQEFRPGVPAFAGAEAAAVDFDPASHWPLMGYNMGAFKSTEIPEIEYLSLVADTAETVFLYAIRTGPLAAA